MPSRYRTRSSVGQTGTIQRYWNFKPDGPVELVVAGGERQDTYDWTGGDFVTPNPFSTGRVRTTCMTASGTFGPMGYHTVYSNVPLRGIEDQSLEALSVSVPSADYANVLARTNPNRPTASLPVFLAELKDLPSLVRQAGRVVRTRAESLKSTKGLASANLAYQFGIAPLVDDLGKMLDFASVVNRKRDQLVRLHSKGGLRRRIELGSASATSDGRILPLNGSRPYVEGYYSKTTTVRRWATVRWLPDTDVVPSADQLDREAWIAAYGLRLGIADIWELLPWSWLIDWFTNIGDLLAAHRGGVPATPYAACEMTHSRTVVTAVRTGPVEAGWSLMGTSERMSETKSRTSLSSPIILPSARLPFLGPGQLSILASLSILKNR